MWRLKVFQGESSILQKWQEMMKSRRLKNENYWGSFVHSLSMTGYICYLFEFELLALLVALIVWIGEMVTFRLCVKPLRKRRDRIKKEKMKEQEIKKEDEEMMAQERVNTGESVVSEQLVTEALALAEEQIERRGSGKLKTDLESGISQNLGKNEVVEVQEGEEDTVVLAKVEEEIAGECEGIKEFLVEVEVNQVIKEDEEIKGTENLLDVKKDKKVGESAIDMELESLEVGSDFEGSSIGGDDLDLEDVEDSAPLTLQEVEHKECGINKTSESK